MCRLFAFRSQLTSRVHKSLLDADNSLRILSNKHPDGWGMGFYIDGYPHVIKSLMQASDDQLFSKVSGVVSSQTVLAHIRKATQGAADRMTNIHPFQYGKWLFAHNGNIKNFENKKSDLLKLLEHPFDRYILGTTDSELLFMLILSKLKSALDNDESFELIEKMIKKIIEQIVEICGPLTFDGSQNSSNNYLTFILTDGQKMIAFNGGQELYYSTHKKKCSESSICQFYDKSCENKAKNKQCVNHLLLSSEMLEGENEWFKIEPYQLVYLDRSYRFHFSSKF